MAAWRGFGAQLRTPTGWCGRVAGAFMRFVNRGPNAAAVGALHVLATDDVLELGFGPGEAIHTLAGLAPQGLVWGLDHSDAMLAQASTRNARDIGRGRVRLLQGAFDRLPVPDQSIDKVLAVNVAYFWDDPRAVLREIWRVLRPGGRISVYVTDEAVMRRWKFAGEDTHRLYDADKLAGLLGQAPFDAARVRLSRVPLPLGLSGLVATVDKPPA